ncbi:hypothetical protein Pint_30024 [Pistacia integerrima]|uniref:Uncharacterized protein n=1 Tax=Pistacia integerrima TaxID=434235 RepID=A0ACC0X0W8_9ROSI|nr:hypothetical protein Pint_30024 [Pistacia integerrima]
MSEQGDDCRDVDERLNMLFPYNIELEAPEEENNQVNWKAQLEEDMKTLKYQDNKNHIAEVLVVNDIDCDDLGSICHAAIVVLSNCIEDIVEGKSSGKGALKLETNVDSSNLVELELELDLRRHCNIRVKKEMPNAGRWEVFYLEGADL